MINDDYCTGWPFPLLLSSVVSSSRYDAFHGTTMPPVHLTQGVGVGRYLIASVATADHSDDDKHSVRCPVDINGAKNTSAPLTDFCSGVKR